MSIDKRPPLGGYKDNTTSFHLTSELLARIRAAATAAEANQSDIIRTGVKRYIENELIPNLTPSEKERYELAFTMELQALNVGEPEKSDDADFIEQL